MLVSFLPHIVNSLNHCNKWNWRLPYLLLESAATDKAPDQSLDVRCCFLLVLLSSPFLPGLPGFVQELGLGALRYSKHCAPWKRII